MPLNLGGYHILRTDVVILSIALAIILIGIGILLKDLIGRGRSPKVDEEPIDLTRFTQTLETNEPPFLAPQPAAAAQPAGDLFVFRRDLNASPADIRSLEETLRKPKKPLSPDSEDLTATEPTLDLEPEIEPAVLELLDLEPEVLAPEIVTPPPLEPAIMRYFSEDAPLEEDEPLELTLAIETPEPVLVAPQSISYFSAVEEPKTAPVVEAAPAVADIRSVVLVCDGYGVGFGSKVILADVGFEVPANGITTLMGPSGTGKSTLLRSLAGLYAQNTLYKSWGEVRYQGEALALENRPAIVTQRIQLTQSLTLDNLAFHVKGRGDYSDDQLRDWATTWLEQVGAHDVIQHLDRPFINLEPVLQRKVTILREAAADASLLMIDEPTTGLSEANAASILTLLQTLATNSALLVVLHNQKEARKISQKIVLLAGGRVQGEGDPQAFFEGTQNPVVAQFVATGSCAVPSPDAPPENLAENVPPPLPLPDAALALTQETAPPPEPVVLPPAEATLPEEEILEPSIAPPPRPAPTSSVGPRGFVWIEEGRLAATPQPGVSNDVDYDLDLLKRVGITTLITLTEQNFPQEALARHGLDNFHLAIPDRKAPSAAEMDMLVTRMRELLDANKVLAVHCRAGLGRTGTIIAAFMVREKGITAQTALDQIRKLNRQFVQSDDQEDFIVEYEVQHEQMLLKDHLLTQESNSLKSPL